jgi:glycosyltransferase involved in cell wall biosynthesis
MTEPAGVLPGLQGLKNQSDEAVYHSVKKSERFNKISAVIITYNEEAIIDKTLSRLSWCNEIIIIDSGSTDRTTEICEEYGCSVYSRSFNGFGEQKRYGVSKAKYNWILCIDADEILSDALIEEIQLELNNSNNLPSAFEMPLNLVFMNKVFKYGSEINCTRIRLFNKQAGNWDGAVVHEKVIVDGAVRRLEGKILHYSYSSYSEFLKKIDLYSTLGAKKLLLKKNRKSKLVIVLGIPFNFFKYYILDRNFLNGFHGFTWSLLNALYHFIKYLKLEELKQLQKENRSGE